MKISKQNVFTGTQCFIAVLIFIMWNTITSVECAVSGYELQAVEAIKRVKKSVVGVSVRYSESSEIRCGTGLIISENGYIITTAHLIPGAERIQVNVSDKEELTASLIGAECHSGIAVVKIERGDLPVPVWENSGRLRTDEIFFALGHPLKFGFTVRSFCGIRPGHEAIATGKYNWDRSSGDTVINRKGEVVGLFVVSDRKKPDLSQPVSCELFVPIDKALKISKFLIDNRTKADFEPLTGISAISVTKEMSDLCNTPIKYGVLVNNVAKDGCCARAGIYPGNIISEVNDTKISSMKDFEAVLRDQPLRQDMKFTVWHGLRKKEIAVKGENSDK
ncbi:MAG: trypsin-like peptidase domain-containing protein [Candidatus Eremiobacteraeota bacterium]|nr:trypsin-like peptidase domain-containing protein [Candidatus Eremiobacteraeota bacterium]